MSRRTLCSTLQGKGREAADLGGQLAAARAGLATATARISELEATRRRLHNTVLVCHVLHPNKNSVGMNDAFPSWGPPAAGCLALRWCAASLAVYIDVTRCDGGACTLV